MIANASSPRIAAATIAVALGVLAIACQDDPKAAPTAAAPAPGQAGDQSFDQAMHIVCDAPDKADLPPASAGEANRAMVLAVWIDKRVRNHEVRQLFGGQAASTPAQKIEALQSGARRAGITRCALADLWQSSAGRTPAPRP